MRMTKLQTVTRTTAEKADAKRRLRCMYDASKELRELHAEEYQDLLNKYKLKVGILPRNLANKHRTELVEQLKESEGHND